MKCGEAATVVIRMNDPFCSSCLIAYLVHKFRAAIGKSKLVRDGERVLVAVSGGPASTSLTLLIQQGLGENVHKKLRFKPSLIYVDEGAALGLSAEERLQNWHEMRKRIVTSGFPGYVTSLQVGGFNCCDKSNEESASTDQSANQQTVFHEVSYQNSPDVDFLDHDRDKLKDLIGSIKSLTEKENFIRILRYRLLLDIARQTGHTKVMCGDTASRLAVKLLSGIAQGRGGHIPFETGFADTRVPDVMFVRPLKDFTLKEVSMFNLYHDTSPLVTPTPTTKMEAGSSIERLTETFVTGLQAGYLATVSNITRTGEKLAHVEGGEGQVTDRCALCQAPLDTDTGPSSAVVALSFSRTLSQSNTTEITASHDGSRLPGVDVLSGLCYGCRITAHDLGDFDKLPEAVKTELYERKNRDKMRTAIQDCLLSDGGT